MKKSLIMLLVLVVVGAMAFAEDAKPTFTITGDTTTTVGYDLNTSFFGFENSSNSTLKVVLVPKTTATKAGEGDVVGQITIKDYGLSFKGDASATDNKSGDVSAKLLIGPAYIQIAGSPDFTFDYAVNIAGPADVNLKTLGSGAGVTLGYTSDAFSASAGVAAFGSYRNVNAGKGDSGNDPLFPLNPGISDDTTGATKQNFGNQLLIGGTVVVKPVTMIEVDVNALTKLNALDGNNYFGVGAKLTLKPVDMITFTTGFDLYNGAYAGRTGMIFDVLPALTVTLGDDTLTASMYYNSLPAGIAIPANTNFSLSPQGAGTTNATETDVKLEFVEADGDKGYVPGLGADIAAELDNLLGTTIAWNVDAKINYTVGALKPYAEVKYDNTNQIKAAGGVIFTGWANTTVTFDYTANDITHVDAGEFNDIGVATLAIKIAY